MKNHFALVLSLCLLGICSVAKAIPIYLLDVPKNGTGGGGGSANGNNQASNFFRLQNVVDNYNLPSPESVGAIDLSSNVVSAGGLIGFDYAVLHYGKGSGGIGQGGGVAFYYLDGASEFTFPAIGKGPNGLGGFSTLTLFRGNDPTTSVPDSGSTLMLLGTALGLIAVARRRFGV